MSRFQFRLLIGGAVLAALVVATAVYAQGSAARGPRGRGFGAGGPQVEFALRALNLKDAQKDQVKEIVQRHREQMQSEIDAILTPEQRDQAAKMRADREARLKQRQDRLQQRQQKKNPA